MAAAEGAAPPPVSGPPPIVLKAAGRSRRRLIANKTAEIVATLAALAAVAALVILVGSVFVKAFDALNWNLVTKGPAVFGETGGGIAPAIAGTIMLVAIAAAIAVPFGTLIAIYVSEFASPAFSRTVKLWLDVLNGFPSIVIGIFVFQLAVAQATPILGLGHKQSAWAGGFALSIIMIPLVARTTMEVLALVPNSLREASYGLGVSKWRTVISIVMPTAFGGILTGTTLAVARAAGETAPLLFTCSIFGQTVSWDPANSVASIPVVIFQYSESPDTNLNAQAWAAAFLLIIFVLVTSMAARVFLDRSRRKLGQTH
jgi:phosphate transport system permease protein